MVDLERMLSKSDLVLLLEIIHECASCTDLIHVDNILLKLRKLFEFDNVVYALAQLHPDGSVASHVVRNISYPQEWMEIYAKKEFHLIDPIIKENFTNYVVQYWAETYKKWECPKSFISTAEDFNLKNGYACGVKNLKGTEGNLISFAGNINDCSRNRFILEVLGPHINHAYNALMSPHKSPTSSPLSARETEILSWIAQGKSSWDISMILSISERTVKFHVNNIMIKLDAVSRAHAVAIALTGGLIRYG